jgi:hypothetical protein
MVRTVLAICLVLTATAATAKPFPWGARDKPPAVAGVSLGDTEQHALDVLGPPDDVTASAMGELLEYGAKGLELTAAQNKIVAIRMFKAETGAIGEVKIGDSARDVILKWGAPLGGQGRVAQFGTDNWIVIVHLADKSPLIVEMTLADKHARPVESSPNQLNVFKTQ